MFKQLEKLLQKKMSRKQFLTTLGMGLVGILGFSAVLKMLGDKALALQGADATVTTADSFKHHNKILLKNGHVITMDSQLGNIAGGDVLVDKGKIVAVGERLPRWGAKVIDATGMIVIPGYVSAHQHLWESLVRGISSNATGAEHRETVLGPLPAKLTVEDMYVGTLVGALDALSNGTTTILNWDLGGLTLKHANAAVDALADARVRGLHSFSAVFSNQNDPNSPPSQDDIRTLAERFDKHPLLSGHMGTRNPFNRTEEVLQRIREDFALGRELGWTISMHHNFATPEQSIPGLLNDNGLLGPDVFFTNGAGFTDAEFALLAEHGSWIVSAPEALQQAGFPVPLEGMLSAGLKPTVCTDSYTHASSYIPAQLRIMLQSAREKNITIDDRMLTMADVFPYGNVNPATQLGMGDDIGSLTVGKQADIVLVDTREDLNTLATTDVYVDLVQMSHPGNIDTVLVAGKVVKHRGELVGHNLRQLRRKLQKHQERLLA